MDRRAVRHPESQLASEKYVNGLKTGMSEIIVVKFTWKRTELAVEGEGGHNLIRLFRKLVQELHLFFFFIQIEFFKVFSQKSTVLLEFW